MKILANAVLRRSGLLTILVNNPSWRNTVRKPDPDDQCICGVPRFRHREGDESCGSFQLKPSYRVLAEAIIDAGYPNRMFVPPALLDDVLGIIARGTVFMLRASPSLLGAQVQIDEKLPDNEIAFGFGETKPLRERLVLV